MLKANLKYLILLATTSLILLTALVVYGSIEKKKSMQMTNVGGRTNQCNCTERIEH
jgi:hypothetical protein